MRLTFYVTFMLLGIKQENNFFWTVVR